MILLINVTLMSSIKKKKRKKETEGSEKLNTLLKVLKLIMQKHGLNPMVGGSTPLLPGRDKEMAATLHLLASFFITGVSVSG